MPQSLEFWTLVISLFALGISVYTWRKSHQNENKLLEIEENRRNDEKEVQNSAVLRADLKIKMDRLIIENIGYSEARNVNIVIDGLPMHQYSGIVGAKESYTIGPQSSLNISTAFGTQNLPSDYIEITWDDDHSTGKTYRNSLSY